MVKAPLKRSLDRPPASLPPFEESALDSVNDAADQFRQLDERWSNRLALHGQSLVKQYQRNRLTLLCDLDISRTLKHCNGAVSRDNQGRIDHFVASVVLSAKVNNGCDLHDWKHKPVFVEDVEIVEAPEGIIPSVVRFYDIHDEVNDFLGGLLYQSAIDGSYKTIPSFSK